MDHDSTEWRVELLAVKSENDKLIDKSVQALLLYKAKKRKIMECVLSGQTVVGEI